MSHLEFNIKYTICQVANAKRKLNIINQEAREASNAFSRFSYTITIFHQNCRYPVTVEEQAC